MDVHHTGAMDDRLKEKGMTAMTFVPCLERLVAQTASNCQISSSPEIREVLWQLAIVTL